MMTTCKICGNTGYVIDGDGYLCWAHKAEQLATQLADLKSPWTYLIDAAGKDTGERPPANYNKSFILSIKVENTIREETIFNVVEAYYLGDGWYFRTDDGSFEPVNDDWYATVVTPYAFQPWPDPAPSPKGGK